MRSKLFSSTLAIALGLATPVVNAIGFPDVVVAQTLEEKKKEADQLLQQGDKQYKMGEFKLALQSWQQALNLNHVIKDRISEGKVLSRLGIAHSSLEDYPKAIEYQERSLTIARELKNRQGENAAFYNLGDIYLSLGNYLKSIEYQEFFLEGVREIKDREGETKALFGLGLAYILIKNYPKAIEFHEQLLDITRKIKDKKGEGNSLLQLGLSHWFLKNYSKLIDYQEKLLIITRELKDRKEEMQVLGTLGLAYVDLENYLKAIEYQQESLVISREIKDSKGKFKALNNLGILFESIGNYREAIDYHKQSLVIARAVKNKKWKGQALGNLGTTYRSIGKYAKAFDFQEKSLMIAREIEDLKDQINSISNFGDLYSSLGDYTKAIESYQLVLENSRGQKDRKTEGSVLNALGLSYSFMGNYEEAIKYLEESLKIARELKNRKGESAALSSLGITYDDLRNHPKAIEYYKQGLVINRELKDRKGESAALGNLGSAYLSLQNFQKSIEYSEKSLAIASDLQDEQTMVITLNNLAFTIIKQNPELAIVFYKKSINMAESIRQNNQRLDKSLQISYTKVVEKSYRNLADLLLRSNRIIEALQILDLLKVKDLQDFLKDIEGNRLNPESVEVLPQEIAILKSFYNSRQPLSDSLQEPAVQIQIQDLQANAANQNLQLKTYTDLQTRVKKLGKNAALFYPLILDDRLELVILTNDRPPIHKPVRISRKQLETEVASFRNQLQNRSRLIKEPAQKLYQSFIQPIEAELKAAGVDTIVYAPDDIMRYVPLAALHDGKQWLAERYQINYLTALALTPLEPDPNKTPKVLAAALSEAHQVKVLGQTITFPARQFTQPEIESLAKTLPNTTTLINQGFNRQTLTTGIPQNTILHLATHGMFVPNSPDQSIIVMGDGSTISLREIEQQWKLPNVSLVVLSACETAIGGKLGNGIEILGFGYQMQRIGSRASISSLWTIDDGGTQGFMNTFYTELKQGKTPAFAIQQTQKDFIQGKVTAKEIEQFRGFVPYVKGGIPTDLTHPFYWAPFILVGNGL